MSDPRLEGLVLALTDLVLDVGGVWVVGRGDGDDRRGEVSMGNEGKEDAGSRDAREELEKMVDAEEKKQGKGGK